MATPDILQKDKDFILYSSIFGDEEGDTVKSRGALIEKKIEILESLASNVSNRRSRRLLNDRLLMELVPRLNAEEIRGLFAPPPWGEEVPVSPFCMANVDDWDKVRNVDMDKEANIVKSIRQRSQKRKSHVDSDKMAVMNAWHRIDCRTREALRRSFLSELIEGYEFYDVISVTEPQTGGSKMVKTTKIKKKKSGRLEIPSLTLSHYLKMSKEGLW
ncbi:uncharacterized protein LOC104898838 isoform X2 [Beta vulgaris subsp. vulgaris]|uniref:uncharacterized protein LOC104898838 isoform X2 n=1 Tax=Beta vulgaris subsp. vulgaris TaxID=3555 RepID=UPI002036823A|nr:uncharacterized protein LOC104898838 isoform X2 [Beta vulgaris subsp. vulgaris]